MSLKTVIYQRLASDVILDGLLSRSVIEGMETEPAIYERWAAPGTQKPYIVLSYSFRAGTGLIKRSGTLAIDIFTGNDDSTENEAIYERLVRLLDMQHHKPGKELISPTDGPIQVYLENDIEVPEPEPLIVHWRAEFSLSYWRRSFIENLNA